MWRWRIMGITDVTWRSADVVPCLLELRCGWMAWGLGSYLKGLVGGLESGVQNWAFAGVLLGIIHTVSFGAGNGLRRTVYKIARGRIHSAATGQVEASRRNAIIDVMSPWTLVTNRGTNGCVSAFSKGYINCLQNAPNSWTSPALSLNLHSHPPHAVPSSPSDMQSTHNPCFLGGFFLTIHIFVVSFSKQS